MRRLPVQKRPVRNGSIPGILNANSFPRKLTNARMKKLRAIVSEYSIIAGEE